MTISKLNKITADLIAKGYGRRTVCIAKHTFHHVLEPDGCTILNVEAAELMGYEMAGDDGGHLELANGCVATRTSLILKGDKP